MGRIDRIAEPWGTRTPYGPGETWPTRVDMHLADGLSEDDVDRWVQSATVLHSNGDGLDIAVKDGRIVGVRGRAEDRVNHGRLGPKDLFGWQANNSPDQAAQGVRDRELLDVTQQCRPQTLRQSTWANAQLKRKATQVLVS